MSAGWMAVACIVGTVVLCLLASWAFDRWHRPRTIRRFQATARQAALAPRTEDDVRRDLATAKAARDLVEQLAFDIAFAKITAAEFPTIPHQTRRTEDPQ